ncbi:MAG: phosphatase PAP2 family protein [Candidatus Doudnabacteria bacterium]|jgi:undecaprenyl-diphosphatase
MISDQNYLNWRQKLENHFIFRWFLVLFGIYSILMVYAVGILLVTQGAVKELVLIVISFVLARLVINPLIFLFRKRQRPYQKLKFIPPNSIWLFSGITEKFNSFPSDHAASFASIAFPLLWFSPIIGIALLVVGLVNGVSRVMLGYHHVSDILAGWLVGAFAAWITLTWLAPIIIK